MQPALMGAVPQTVPMLTYGDGKVRGCLFSRFLNAAKRFRCQSPGKGTGGFSELLVVPFQPLAPVLSFGLHQSLPSAQCWPRKVRKARLDACTKPRACLVCMDRAGLGAIQDEQEEFPPSELAFWGRTALCQPLGSAPLTVISQQGQAVLHTDRVTFTSAPSTPHIPIVPLHPHTHPLQPPGSPGRR